MSEGLLLYDGGLLFVDGGLTDDPNCCCYYEPPGECPPCCIRIDWGTFDDDGNLVDNYVVSGIPITVKVSMPTPNSRIVCDTEQVTVRWELDAPADNYGAWVRFGPGWGFNGESPIVGPDGETYDWGLVDWVGTSADAFQVTLTFRKCFMDSGQFNYFIIIGTDFPDWDLDIESSRCTTPNECCPEEVDCEDCCGLLDQEGVIKYDGKYYIAVNTVDPDGNIFTGVIEFELERAGILCQGDGIDITLWLVPPRHEDIENNTVIDFPGWELGTYSPDVSIDDGEVTEIKVDWGTLTKYRYDISLSIDCDNEVCDPILEFPTITITNTPFNVGAGIAFNECDVEDCCCPTYCTCGCMWPLSSGFCENALEDDLFGLYEIGGETEITDLLIEITADSDVFCGGTKNKVKLEQAGESWHLGLCVLVNGKLCPRTQGLLVPMIDESQHCGSPGSPAGRAKVNLSNVDDCGPKVQVSIDFSMEMGKPFSAQIIPIDSGGLVGCDEINAGGSMTLDGVEYSWVITGNVIGGIACPCGEE